MRRDTVTFNLGVSAGIVVSEIIRWFFFPIHTKAEEPIKPAPTSVQVAPSATVKTVQRPQDKKLDEYDRLTEEANKQKYAAINECEEKRKGVAVWAGLEVICVNKQMVIFDKYIEYPRFPW